MRRILFSVALILACACAARTPDLLETRDIEGTTPVVDGSLGPNLEFPTGTVASLGPMATTLRQYGYQRGHVRVWRYDNSDIIVLKYEMADAHQAKELVRAVGRLNKLATSQNQVIRYAARGSTVGQLIVQANTGDAAKHVYDVVSAGYTLNAQELTPGE